MKLAMMQPYLFPYLGYFQLIHASDFFGIADDVQYIKRGWINKNKILNKDKALSIGFSVEKNSHQSLISDRIYSDQFDYEKQKFRKILLQCYSKAPFFLMVMEMIDEILRFSSRNLSEFNVHQLKSICNYLEIKTPFIYADSWKISQDILEDLSPEQKLLKKIEQVKDLSIDHYVNSIGGQLLYNKQNFISEGYNLSFLKMKPIRYKQFENAFISDLSILDVLMFNSKDQINNYLDEYELL